MVKKILLSILNFIVRLSLAALIAVLVYRLAMYSYHFGYMVFADASVEPIPGRDIVLTVDSTEDVMDLGRLLKARGLITDEKIFFVQERLSDYHGKLMPGTYTLNTSMKVEEMLETMAGSYQEEEESKSVQSEGSSQSTDNSQGNVSYDPETGEMTGLGDGALSEGQEEPELEENTDTGENADTDSAEDGQMQGGFGAGAGL